MTKTCPDSGALRAALDGERPDVAAHVADCASCQARSAAQADDAAFAAARFGAPPSVGDGEVGTALERIRAQTVAPVVPLSQRRFDSAAWMRAAAAFVAVALVGGMLSTPGGRAAAASWLERFRAEQVTAVPVDFTTVDPAALEGLIDLAEVEGLDDIVDPQPVADLEAAAGVAGFTASPLNRDALPPAAQGPVHVLAQAPQTVRITFPEQPDIPADIHGVTLVLKVPGAIVQAVGNDDGPVAIRGEAGTLEVLVEGDASLAEVREALLSLPGLPQETVAALRAIEDWETTLPLPVPAGRIAWSETTVAGRPGLAFGDESGLASVLLWHDGERFVGVGGRLPLSQVRQLAEGSG